MFVKKLKFLFTSIIVMGVVVFPVWVSSATVTSAVGDLIMKKGSPTIYYVGTDEKAYVFPDEKTYKTWYPDFRDVKIVSRIPKGKGSITVRPGVKLVKFYDSNKVYAVSKGAILHWITSADIAKKLYGTYWDDAIIELSRNNVASYTIGDDITDADKYDVSREKVLASSINKELINAGKIVEKKTNTKPVDAHSFALLTSLKEDLKASLSPRFKSSITSYTLHATYDEQAVVLKPRVNRDDTKIFINDLLLAQDASANFLLKQGKNHFDIKVVAATGESTLYSLDIMRDEPSGNAYLKSLSDNLKSDFDPAFLPDVYEYKVTVAYTKSVWIPKVRAEDKLAKITYKNKTAGTGYTEDNTFALAYGTNEIEIRVRAQSGAVRTYTVNVYRNRHPELGATYLKSLSTDINYAQKGISPSFDSQHTLYYAHTSEDDESVLIQAQAKHKEARVFIDGINSTSRKVPLSYGRNEFEIIVEVDGGYNTIYKLTIDRGAYEG